MPGAGSELPEAVTVHCEEAWRGGRMAHAPRLYGFCGDRHSPPLACRRPNNLADRMRRRPPAVLDGRPSADVRAPNDELLTATAAPSRRRCVASPSGSGGGTTTAAMGGWAAASSSSMAAPWAAPPAGCAPCTTSCGCCLAAHRAGAVVGSRGLRWTITSESRRCTPCCGPWVRRHARHRMRAVAHGLAPMTFLGTVMIRAARS